MLGNTLYRRTTDGLLLKCLGSDQSRIAMGEVHEGICGTYQFAHKLKWLLYRAWFYWQTMLNDCFRYYKGYESCQKFRDVQLASAAMLHPIIKPWPFHSWTLDFIGQIHPTSSKCHRFVLVAMDYFTKWMEAVPLKNMTHREANGHAESSNKTLINLIKKKIEGNPKRWHEVLLEALWAHHISKHSATKVTPFKVVYGQEVVLPMEVNLDALRVAQQK
jgi:hypothetical protein